MEPRRARAWRAFGLALMVSGLARLAAGDCCPGVRTVATEWPLVVTAGSPGPSQWMASDSSGLYAVWSAVDDVYLTVSRDDGATWEPPRVAVADVNTSFIAPILDARGRFVLPHLTTGAVMRVAATASFDSGRTFTPPRILSGPLNLGWVGSATDRTGLTAVAWVGRGVVPGSGTDALQVALTDDGGLTWSPARTVIEANVASVPALVFTDTALIVGWTTPDGAGGRQAWTSRSVELGVSWSPPSPVPFSGIAPFDLAFGYTRAGRVQATAQSSAGWLLIVSTDDGATWPTDETLLGPVRGGLLCTPAGHVHAAWAHENVMAHQASMSDGLAGSWSAPSRPGPDAIRPEIPLVFEPSTGTVVVVHEDYRDEQTPCTGGAVCQESIYVELSCDEGRSWSSHRLDRDDDPQHMHSETPAAVVSTTGRVHAIWTDMGSNWWSGVDMRHAGFDARPDALAVRETNGTLRVGRDGARLALTWNDDSSGPTADNVYAGRIATLNAARRYDHAAVGCHVPRTSELGPHGIAVEAPVVDTYYVVVPADCGAEGSAGADSRGTERPLVGLGSACGPVP